MFMIKYLIALGVMHCKITFNVPWSDGLLGVHLAEVPSESVVDVPHLVWPGTGVSTLDHCSILSWYTEFSVP